MNGFYANQLNDVLEQKTRPMRNNTLLTIDNITAECLYGMASMFPASAVTIEQRNQYEDMTRKLRLRDKDGRMNRRLNRQRVALWKRRWWKGAAVLLCLVAIPGAIVIVTKAWGWAVQVVLG